MYFRVPALVMSASAVLSPWFGAELMPPLNHFLFLSTAFLDRPLQECCCLYVQASRHLRPPWEDASATVAFASIPLFIPLSWSFALQRYRLAKPKERDDLSSVTLEEVIEAGGYAADPASATALSTLLKRDDVFQAAQAAVMSAAKEDEARLPKLAQSGVAKAVARVIVGHATEARSVRITAQRCAIGLLMAAPLCGAPVWLWAGACAAWTYVVTSGQPTDRVEMVADILARRLFYPTRGLIARVLGRDAFSSLRDDGQGSSLAMPILCFATSLVLASRVGWGGGVAAAGTLGAWMPSLSYDVQVPIAALAVSFLVSRAAPRAPERDSTAQTVRDTLVQLPALELILRASAFSPWAATAALVMSQPHGRIGVVAYGFTALMAALGLWGTDWGGYSVVSAVLGRGRGITSAARVVLSSLSIVFTGLVVIALMLVDAYSFQIVVQGLYGFCPYRVFIQQPFAAAGYVASLFGVGELVRRPLVLGLDKLERRLAAAGVGNHVYSARPDARLRDGKPVDAVPGSELLVPAQAQAGVGASAGSAASAATVGAAAAAAAARAGVGAGGVRGEAALSEVLSLVGRYN